MDIGLAVTLEPLLRRLALLLRKRQDLARIYRWDTHGQNPLHLAADFTDDAFNNQGFFDKFTADAKVASERKRREVLDELFQHEEDPLYWLQGASKVNQSENSTPTPSCIASETASSVGKSLIDLDSPSDSQAKDEVPPILPRSPSAAPPASHTAPGFTGNRGFEFDKTQVERKSVLLTGREKMTVPVLTVEIADMLRPFFPALERPPRGA
ncbi:hypothetical protein BD413DRAFT_610150 [Trametes elegans]|nr:hypothetical protein BD413DRAFT_610150 [Trametes elegans]